MTNAFLPAGAACVAMVAAPAVAAPVVTVDIPPVYSLAAQVMQYVGAPTLIVQPGASPHGYSMRPSEAAALQASDVVIWVGAGLTPWLERTIGTVAADATSLALLTVPGVTTLGFREGATFEAHDDDHGGEGHAHDNQADDAHGRDHEGVDPHAWLDPDNARLWLDAIAGALSAADPASATTYFRNAAAGKAALDALSAEIAADLAPLAGRGFVVFHDAYHYFEARFGVEAAGAIAIGDAATPGPARVSEIKGAIDAMNAACVFSEPQFEPALVETVTEGTDARTGELDPLGADLAPGPDLTRRCCATCATAWSPVSARSGAEGGAREAGRSRRRRRKGAGRSPVGEGSRCWSGRRAAHGPPVWGARFAVHAHAASWRGMARPATAASRQRSSELTKPDCCSQAWPNASATRTPRSPGARPSRRVAMVDPASRPPAPPPGPPPVPPLAAARPATPWPVAREAMTCCEQGWCDCDARALGEWLCDREAGRCP